MKRGIRGVTMGKRNSKRKSGVKTETIKIKYRKPKIKTEDQEV